MIWVFALSLILISLNYFLFPLFVGTLSLFKKAPAGNPNHLPKVSIVVAAFNEGKVLSEKVANCYALNYPKDLFEIIIVTDGSSDGSHETIQALHPEITVLHNPARRGKSSALNRGVNEAKNEILLFTDANTYLEPDSLRYLVAHFYDPKIGGVSGRKQVFINKERASSQGDRAYWNYESLLKTWESKVGSVSTGDGEIFALRKTLYSPLSVSVINDDMELTLNMVESGYRVIYEPKALASEEASKTLKEDFRVKARMVCGGFQLIQKHAAFLFFPFRFFSFQFFSHKTLRYLMPVLLLALYFSTAGLAFSTKETWLLGFLGLQTLFCFASILGFFLYESSGKAGLLYFPLYFSYMNVGALVGLYYFIGNQGPTAIWKKAER